MAQKTNFSLPKEPIISKAYMQAGRNDVVKWEVVPLAAINGFTLVFEGWEKSSRHGVWLKVDGELEINNISSKSMEIWADTAPERVGVKVRNSIHLHLYNLWDEGKGRQSQAYTSGMLVEELSNGRRYRCNDIGIDPKFDHLVFRIEWLPRPLPE